MKKMALVFIGFFFLLISPYVHGQSKTGADYFAGKWNVLVKGTPGGDSKIFVVLEKKDSTITGVIQDSTGMEISKIDNIELKDSSLTVFFKAQGYDVNLLMNKKDEDHVMGSLMAMFEAEGVRVKDEK